MSRLVTIQALDEGVIELHMDDAEAHNRLSEPLCHALMAGLSEIAGRSEARVVLLSGRADVFCGGATLEALESVSTGAVDVLDLHLPDQMLGFPLPIVGALEGHAVGGGLTLALCCDVLVAAATSRYGFNFTDMGFTPGMGTTALLPLLVGHHRAMEMMLSARFYRGAELEGVGLFNRVVPAADVRATALDIALQMADKPRHVLEMVKATLADPRRQALQAGMSREHLMHRVCFGHPGTRQRIAERYIESAKENRHE